jgi:hypothetical protein
MAAIQGNYWLDLIEKEEKLRQEIEAAVDKLIGKKFKDYVDMASQIKDAIRIRLENYGVKHRMGFFDVEYDLDLQYDISFRLGGFVIKFVNLNADW